MEIPQFKIEISQEEIENALTQTPVKIVNTAGIKEKGFLVKEDDNFYYITNENSVIEVFSKLTNKNIENSKTYYKT